MSPHSTRLDPNLHVALMSPLNRPNSASCSICVIALGPSFPACEPAVTAQGANTPSNTACLAAAAQGSAAFPSPCAPCAAPFGVTDPANKSQGAAITNKPNAGSPASANNAAPANAAALRPRSREQTPATYKAPCIIAFGPSFPACAPAVSQLGANTAFNSACITAAAKGSSPFPSACGGCATQLM
ncbi:hypothetical protein B0H17DRAFT_1136942 [Mycena rosella]|uniref:Uncharacterized protein n=1 Tax=Mycena rosella TaxID=1033263 RepID=A0AAD7DD02_MYCRO|nr:hypothetical protein B0H17DRAFT_1136942 [Mycena rosella]